MKTGSNQHTEKSDSRNPYQCVQAAAMVFSEESPWLREVLFAGWTEGGLRQAWEDLLTAMEALAAEAGTAHQLIIAHGPELPVSRIHLAQYWLILDISCYNSKTEALRW